VVFVVYEVVVDLDVVVVDGFELVDVL